MFKKLLIILITISFICIPIFSNDSIGVIVFFKGEFIHILDSSKEPWIKEE